MLRTIFQPFNTNDEIRVSRRTYDGTECALSR